MRVKVLSPSLCRIFLEISTVGLLAVFLLSKVIITKWNLGGSLPVCPDHWLSAFTLEYQITRILGSNPGSLWEGGYFFPFHKVSLLFNEPTWGISLMVLPVWFFVRDIFFINNFGGVVALILVWISTYWFSRALGSKRIYAFFSALTFCLSGASLGLILDVYFFWPFFFIPILGWLLLKIRESSKLIFGVFFGIGYGYLAWSSAHLAVMGGIFLLFFGCWLWFREHSKSSLLSILLAVLITIILAGALYIHMYFVQKEFGRAIPYAEQVLYASNWSNILNTQMQWERPLNFFKIIGFWKNITQYAKGETPIGISVIVILLSVYYTVFFIFSKQRKQERIQHPKKLKVLFYYLPSLLIALFNLLILKLFLGYLTPLKLSILYTLIIYFTVGTFIVFYRNKIIAALNEPSLFFILLAVFMGFLSFGPYYTLPNNSAIPSPVILFSYIIPGISSIRATARWGLMVSFCLSIGIFLGLSNGSLSRIVIISLLSLVFCELFTGLPNERPSDINLYNWRPREVDIFLKNIEKKGAVLELTTYPIKHTLSGPEMYSSLYHKRPIVTGYATVMPKAISRYLYDAERGFDLKTVLALRKFGARYWVFHIDNWEKTYNFSFKKKIAGLRRIAIFNEGKTLLYEDPEPKISLKK